MQELEQSLNELKELVRLRELSSGSVSHPEEVRSILKILESIDVSSISSDMGKSLQLIVDIARIVIGIRKGIEPDDPLNRLPVPPYDLWLPFKGCTTITGGELFPPVKVDNHSSSTKRPEPESGGK